MKTFKQFNEETMRDAELLRQSWDCLKNDRIGLPVNQEGNPFDDKMRAIATLRKYGVADEEMVGALRLSGYSDEEINALFEKAGVADVKADFGYPKTLDGEPRANPDSDLGEAKNPESDDDNDASMANDKDSSERQKTMHRNRHYDSFESCDKHDKKKKEEKTEK